MSKYQNFAKKLNNAFVAARAEYAAAAKALETAQNRANERQPNSLERQRAQLALAEAQEAFREAESRIWPEFNRKRAELGAELAQAVQGDSTANPDAVDPNALELLKSGIMGPADYSAMADKYENNPTMLRLIAAHAKETADTMQDRAGRGALYQLAQRYANGQGPVLQCWASLTQVADHCSGQAHGRREAPDIVVSMANRWEQLAGDAIDNF